MQRQPDPKSLVGRNFSKETHELLVNRIKLHRDFSDEGNKDICSLNDLSNWNKHNLLLFAVGETGFSGKIGATEFKGNTFLGAARKWITWDAPDRHFEHQIEPSFSITFG